MKRRKFLGMIVIIMLIAGLLLAGCTGDGTPPPAQQEEEEEEEEEEEVEVIELTFGVWDPPEIPMMRVVQASWAKWIEQESNGRLKIKFLYSETVAKAPELADACVNGLVDIVWEAPGMVPQRWRVGELSTNPLIFKFPGSMNTGLANYELYQKYGEYIDAEWPGLKIVGFHANSPSHINTIDKQVHVLEDLEGLILNNRRLDIGDALGFTSEVVNPGEGYDALAKGVLDGTLHEFEGHYVWNHYELCNYTTEVGVNVGANFVHLMNEDVFNGLPADLQALFTGENMKLVSYINGYNFDRDDGTFRGVIEQYRADRGNPDGIYILPDDERQRWVDAVLPVRDIWIADAEAKGAPGADMMDDILMLAEQLEQQSPDEKCPWCEEWFHDLGADGY